MNVNSQTTLCFHFSHYSLTLSITPVFVTPEEPSLQGQRYKTFTVWTYIASTLFLLLVCNYACFPIYIFYMMRACHLFCLTVEIDIVWKTKFQAKMLHCRVIIQHCWLEKTRKHFKECLIFLGNVKQERYWPGKIWQNFFEFFKKTATFSQSYY